KKEAPEDEVLESIHQPCILIFDSLRTSSKNPSRIVATLRDYLAVEWKRKHGDDEKRVFDKNTIRGYCVRCPQQDNFSDCGVYLLQYVESFFCGDAKVTDFRLPLKRLENWFSAELMRRKRRDIAELFLRLTEESNPNVLGILPKLEFDCDQFETVRRINEVSNVRKEENGPAGTEVAGVKTVSEGPAAPETSKLGGENGDALGTDDGSRKKRGFSIAIPRVASVPGFDNSLLKKRKIDEISPVTRPAEDQSS
ncbi:unnamed protein product, partial [Notodromas monacha]